jgi:hypothetical protein
LSSGTINKLLSCVQAVSVFARDQGLIPEDAPWSDPFANQHLKQDQPERGPFTVAELKLLFARPVFTKGERPKGGKGEVAFWLPLLGLTVEEVTFPKLPDLPQLKSTAEQGTAVDVSTHTHTHTHTHTKRRCHSLKSFRSIWRPYGTPEHREIERDRRFPDLGRCNCGAVLLDRVAPGRCLRTPGSGPEPSGISTGELR